MKMLHVTIRTNRFEEELKFYQEIAELAVTRDMRPMGREMIFLSNGEGETEIEIIGTPEAENAGNEFLSIGFRTQDVEAKREELLEKGLDVSPMVSPGPQVKFFHVTDPAGVRVQFM